MLSHYEVSTMKISKSLYEILTVCQISYLLDLFFSKLDQKVQEDDQHQILTSYPTIVWSVIHEPIIISNIQVRMASEATAESRLQNLRMTGSSTVHSMDADIQIFIFRMNNAGALMIEISFLKEEMIQCDM